MVSNSGLAVSDSQVLAREVSTGLSG